MKRAISLLRKRQTIHRRHIDGPLGGLTCWTPSSYSRFLMIGLSGVLFGVALSACKSENPESLRIPPCVQVPEYPDWVPHSDREAYRKGYKKGWDEFAARWKCRASENNAYVVSGNYVECADDSSTFQKGFEDGQLAASEIAEKIELELLPQERDPE